MHPQFYNRAKMFKERTQKPERHERKSQLKRICFNIKKQLEIKYSQIGRVTSFDGIDYADICIKRGVNFFVARDIDLANQLKKQGYAFSPWYGNFFPPQFFDKDGNPVLERRIQAERYGEFINRLLENPDYRATEIDFESLSR